MCLSLSNGISGPVMRQRSQARKCNRDATALQSRSMSVQCGRANRVAKAGHDISLLRTRRAGDGGTSELLQPGIVLGRAVALRFRQLQKTPVVLLHTKDRAALSRKSIHASALHCVS